MSVGLLERPFAVKDAQQVLDVDEVKGLVRAIVSVTGVVDEVGDIIEPGAYAKTLRTRTPKVCDGHDWAKPIGLCVHAEEWLPGDPRLPEYTKDGQKWPAKAGALVCDIQFNMDSERGQQAFKDVRFYSERGVAEWSIGYQVPDGKATRDRDGFRHIKEVDLYTTDPVLFGAAPLSMTLDIKSADLGAAAAWLGRHNSPGYVAVGVERKGGDPEDVPQEVKYDTSPVGKPGGRQNWVDKVGGLPPFIRAIAHALIRNGKSESNAIQIAIGTCQRWARGEGKVSAKTRAKAADAIAEYERKRAEAHAKSLVYDPALEVGPDAGHVRTEPAAHATKTAETLTDPGDHTLAVKAFPYLPGTYEERLETIRQAATEYLRKWWKANGPDPDGDGDTDADPNDNDMDKMYVSIEGTTDSAVIATLWEPDGDRHTYQMSYDTGGDGNVTFGLPDEVRLTVVPQSLNDSAEDGSGADDLDEDMEEWLSTVADWMPPVDEMVKDAASVVSRLLVLVPETKAGRVLSGSNAGLLRQAVEHLIAVLKAAGIEVDANQAPADATNNTPDTTAPTTPEPVGAVAQKGLDGGFPDPVLVLASIDAALDR